MVKTAGFTLMELMIIIAIMSVTAGLAGPAIHDALAERRAAQAPLDVIRLIRRARSESMAYGRAHLVRYNGATPGTSANPGQFQLFRGLASSCNANDWATLVAILGPPPTPVLRREILAFANNPYVSGTTSTVAWNTNGGGLGTIDICYEPMGNTLFRTNVASPFTANNTAAIGGGFRFSFQRFENAAAAGPIRQIVIPIGGDAREVR